jgi:hypothetical protein
MALWASSSWTGPSMVGCTPADHALSSVTSRMPTTSTIESAYRTFDRIIGAACERHMLSCGPSPAGAVHTSGVGDCRLATPWWLWCWVGVAAGTC